MKLSPGKKIYFLSDFHLGAPDQQSSMVRERKLVSFFSAIAADAGQLFILGDMFDFWYEYRRVVPRGFTRVLGKLAMLNDAGVQIHFFPGNHDMWMKDYLQQEIGATVYRDPTVFSINGKKMLIGHGDGLGPGDQGYKMLKKVFRNPFCQWLFGILPPAIGMGLADFFSRKSREATGKSEEHFMGADKEWLISYCRQMMREAHYDYFIFGHRHLPIDFRLSETSRYINLGDWIQYFTYAVFDGQHLQLKARYPSTEDKIIRAND